MFAFFLFVFFSSLLLSPSKKKSKRVEKEKFYFSWAKAKFYSSHGVR
jgi:hypothetical protein